MEEQKTLNNDERVIKENLDLGVFVVFSGEGEQ